MKLLVNIALFLLKKCIWVIVVFLLGVVLIGTINWTKSQFETEENRKAAVEKIKHEIHDFCSTNTRNSSTAPPGIS